MPLWPCGLGDVVPSAPSAWSTRLVCITSPRHECSEYQEIDQSPGWVLPLLIISGDVLADTLQGVPHQLLHDPEFS